MDDLRRDRQRAASRRWQESISSTMTIDDALIVLILVFQVTTMLSFGLRLTARQIVEPMHNVQLVISSLVASYCLIA